MKKLFIYVALALTLGMGASCSRSARANQTQPITQVMETPTETDTAKYQPPQKMTANATATGEYHTTKDGQRYPIYLSQNGRAFIVRLSKNNNYYKQYLGEDKSRELCGKCGVAYKDLGK